jgi:hypothetical protein
LFASWYFAIFIKVYHVTAKVGSVPSTRSPNGSGDQGYNQVWLFSTSTALRSRRNSTPSRVHMVKYRALKNSFWYMSLSLDMSEAAFRGLTHRVPQ